MRWNSTGHAGRDATRKPARILAVDRYTGGCNVMPFRTSVVALVMAPIDTNSHIRSTVVFNWPIQTALVIPTTRAPPPNANKTVYALRFWRVTSSGRGRSKIDTSVTTFKILVISAKRPTTVVSNIRKQ